MKKTTILSLFLSIVLILSGCGASSPETLEEACAQADEIVSEWDSKSKNLCNYTSSFTTEGGVAIYLVLVESLTVQDETDFAKQQNAQTAASLVNNELGSLFSGFDVALGVAVLDDNGETYYLTSNGDVLFNAYA